MALTKITSDVIETGAITSDKLASGAVSASSLSSITTDNVSEGSTNTYFTNARARSSVSVTGGGLSYDSGTGVIQIGSIPNASLTNSSLTVNSNSVSLGGSVTLDTDDIGEGSTNLYFTNARAQGAISGGTGVTVSSGTISIGQDVATSSTPTFGNITTTGYIAGPATFTIDPAAVGDNTGTVVIAGNLQVDGTTTTINSTTMTVDDLNITLASGAANAAAANGAGITVDGASATITYDGTNDEWDFNKDINVTGNITTQSGGLTVGVSDTTGGVITVHGGATGNNEGGEIRLQTSADHDGTYDFYRLDVVNDTFRIGREGTTDLTINSSGNAVFGGTISSGAITAGGVVSATDLKTTAQASQVWEAPSAASGNTEEHQMRARWNANNNRWFLVPFPESSPLYSREFYFDYSTSEWVLEGAPTINASGLHGSPNITVGTINSGAISSIGNSNFGVTGSGAYAVNIHTSGNSDAIAIYATSTTGTTDQSAIRWLADNSIKAQMGLAIDSGRILSGTSADDFAIKSWGNIRFGNSSGTNTFTITSTGNLQADGQTVIDSSRNLTNIGTISSGTHTITSTGTIGTTTPANGYLQVTDGSATLALDPNEIYSSSDLVITTGGDFDIRNGSFSMGDEIVITSSKNIINVGTITASGDLAIDTDTLFVDVSTDRVGINNSSPLYPLDFPTNQSGLTIRVGDANVDSYIAFSNPRGFVGFDATGYMTLQGGNSKGIRLNVNNSTFGNGAALTIDISGNATFAGNGTFVSDSTDSRALYLKQHASNNGNILQFVDQAGTNVWELVGRNNQFYIYNNNLSTFSLFINPSSNNIGIGHNSTNEKLDVNGSVKIGDLKIQNADGGRIGLNRNTANGAIYNSGYSAFQINGAYSGANYLDFQEYTSAGTYNGGMKLQDGKLAVGSGNSNFSGTPENAISVAHDGHGLGLDYVGATLPRTAGMYTSSTAHTQTGYGDLNIKARTDYGNYYGIGFFTAASNSTPERRMKIDSNGNVTKPNQCFFFCRPPGSHSITANTDHVVTGTWAQNHDVGNNFGTNSFTAPVDGVYAFNWSIFLNHGSSNWTRADAFIRVNSSIQIRTEQQKLTNANVNHSQMVHGILKLSANDVVTFGVYVNASTTIYVATSPWSYATGYLLG